MLRAPAAILSLLLTTLSSHAALVASPQRPVSAPKPGVAAIERVLDVATDGTDFLTVWSERDEARRGMYAGIVNEQGVARTIPAAPFSEGSFAQAVWTGDTYLVVAQDAGDRTIALRMNRDAQVVSERSVLDVGPGFVSELAWNGTRAFALVRTAQTMTGALLDSRGRVRRSGIAIPVQKLAFATVTAAGDAFIVAWSEEADPLNIGDRGVIQVRAVRVSTSGEVSEPVELMAPTRAAMHHFDAASSGNAVGIAFTVRIFPEPFLRMHRFTIDGRTLAIEEHPEFSVPQEADAMEVIPAPGGFAAAYTFYAAQALRLGSVRFHSSARLSVEIGPVGGYGMRTATNGRTVLAAFGGATAVAVTLNADATDRKSAIAPVSIATARQSHPMLASSGDQMLAAWLEPDFPNGSVLLAQRRNASGDPIDAEPIVVTRGGIADSPAIAFTGKVWLIAWPATGGVDAHVFAKRLSPEGTVLDAAPIDVGVGGAPALASNGTVTALVMDQPRYADIHLVRFSPEGTKLDSIPITPANPGTSMPSVATNGTEFLVTWTEAMFNVLGRRLSADGTPMDAAPVVIASGPENAPQSRGNSRVASNGEDFVVAYVQWEPIPRVNPPIGDMPPTIFRVFTKRVLRNGTLADTTAEQDGALLGEGVQPQIAAFGNGYVATFIESQQPPYDRLSLFAVPLDERGVPAAAPTAVLRNVRSYSNKHSLAVIGSRIEVAYGRVAPQFGNVQRVFLRALASR